jgi:secreted PhoX family phosphatase
VVVYMGDDQRFDYVYKFVTKNALSKDQPDPDLLDDGTLFVAKFAYDGVVDWLALRFGEGPLNETNGFNSQADVLIEARRAADLLGATPMDRPEDVQPDQKTGRVWIMLTNNHQRSAAQVNAANPRANNNNGHIIEIVEPAGNFGSTRSRWEILVKCGDPNDDTVEATWNIATSDDGWFGSPDNAALDGAGRLWVATDGNHTTGAADGVWAVETSGARKGTGSSFFRAPIGAEVCGPQFSADSKTLFLSVQHPGDGPGASFENPLTRWPDFQPTMPPRPSVLAIRQLNGDPIGS